MRELILALALAGCSPAASGPPLPGAAVLVSSIAGRAIDLDGNGVGPTNVTFCGAGRCYGDRSDEDGSFVVRVDDTIALAAYRLHVDGRPRFADRMIAVDGLAAPALVFAEPIRTPRLPDTGPDLVSDGPAVMLTSAGVSVLVAEGTAIDFGFQNSTAPNGKTFRAAPVPGDAFADWGPLALVVALAPFGTSTSLPLGVRVDAAGSGLPAGAAVELLVLEDRYEQPGLGQMQSAARGHVSADGTRIETDPGEGISRLTWLGVRAAR